MEKELSHDEEFMVHIFSEICDYAVKNKMEPDDTMRTIAKNILAVLEISTFNNWGKEKASEERDNDM